MPEANVPTLNLPTGLSSETETTSTGRSDSSVSISIRPPPLQPPPPQSSNVNIRAPVNGEADESKLPKTLKQIQILPIPTITSLKQQASHGQTRKIRKSCIRRAPKKPQTHKANSGLQKASTPTVLTLHSHIPRRALLLTPSSSNASLVTNCSVAPETSSSTTTATCDSSTPSSGSSKAATPRLLLQRQPTAAILKFHARKSVSQMDLKHARRSGHYLPKAPSNCANANGRALMPSSATFKLGSSSQVSIIDKLLDQNYFATQERESRCAGIRIFATIMLNAWRKRRDEVKRLSQEVDELKRGSIKSKNQLHVFNTLFRVEQRRNDELNCQLKRSVEDINSAKSNCESLTTSLISLKADKALLEQELSVKEHEFEGLNEMLTQTKSELFKAMTQQRELQSDLSIEQRKVQNLENQKNELINEICELNNDAEQKAEMMRTSLEMKDAELTDAKETIQKYEEMLNELKSKDVELGQLVETEEKLKNELHCLEIEAEALRKCLNTTLDNRLKNCWQHTTAYHKATLQMLHLLLFCVLPAVPPPKVTKIPFALSLEKALSIVKR